MHNKPQLQTSAFCDIFVGVQSICAFIVIMKMIGFLLDCLHGTNDKTFINGRTTLMVRIIPYVRTNIIYVCKYSFKSYGNYNMHTHSLEGFHSQYLVF
jgi:uncharacterized membrane protein